MTRANPHRRGRIRRRTGVLGAVAVLPVMFALTAASERAEASAFIHVVMQPVQQMSGGLCTARVGVDVNMSEADALAFIAHPGDELTVRLWGNDPIWDDALISLPVDAPTWPQAWAGGYSVEFTRVFGCHLLDEDPEGFDEIYAQATFNDFRTGQTHHANSADVLIDL